MVQEANGRITATKLTGLIAAKWREYQEENPFIDSKPRKSRNSAGGSAQKTVAPIKIRISSRPKKRKKIDGEGSSVSTITYRDSL